MSASPSKKLSKKLKVLRRPPVPIRIMIQDGRFKFQGIGAWYSYWRDPYHLMLTVPWPGFLFLIALAYIGINGLFASAYLLGGDNIANARPGSLVDAFFFSVQTFASIGYGAMTPKTFYANILVTFEAWVELLSLAVITGLAFARFSRPTARVLFSEVAVITPYQRVPTLMFRAANQRRNQVLEAQMLVYLMMDEISEEGTRMRRFYDLNLTRSRTPSFVLTWTAMHPIDEQSPLYGLSQESLLQAKATFSVSLSGIDETVNQTIYARHVYAAQDIRENHRLVDIFSDTPDGHREIDYTKFHDVVPIIEKPNLEGHSMTSSKAENS
jgi:inward rectifier potassium channel